MPKESVRSNLVALALPACAYCRGTAMKSPETVCRCVDRKVFRICLDRFRDIEAGELFLPPISLESAGHGPRGYRIMGRKNEEYAADFMLVARRTLKPLEFAVLR